MKFILLAAYVAIGALFHLVLIGSKIDLTSAKSLLMLLGWPFVGFFWFVVIVALVIAFLIGRDWLARKRAERRRRKARAGRI